MLVLLMSVPWRRCRCWYADDGAGVDAGVDGDGDCDGNTSDAGGVWLVVL